MGAERNGVFSEVPWTQEALLRAEDLHDQLLWKMNQSPALLSTHAPPKHFLPGPQFSQRSEEEFTADSNGNDDITANMFETCNVLFDSPQPYEEGKSLPSFDR